jgi:hypothetical protein
MMVVSRREVLAMAAVGAFMRRSAGAQQSEPFFMYRDYSRCLPDYLASHPLVDPRRLASTGQSGGGTTTMMLYDYPFGNFVTSLLAHTDLPDLIISLAPRRVTMAGTVDGAGNRMAPEAVRAELASAANIRVLPEPAWSPSDILAAMNSLWQ